MHHTSFSDAITKKYGVYDPHLLKIFAKNYLEDPLVTNLTENEASMNSSNIFCDDIGAN
jgi:hypothetical protein